MQPRRLALSSLALALLAALASPSSSHAYGRWGGGYGWGYGYSTWGPSPAFSSAYYVSQWPAYGGGYELSDEDMYLGSKRKGDRMMQRGKFSKAVREYRNALNRATKFFGADSKKAKEAERLLARAQEQHRTYGDARDTQFAKARRRADSLFDRGKYAAAARHYERALQHAHTDTQAQQAVKLLVRAKNARDGGGPVRRKLDDYKGRGDDAMNQGDFQAALGFYASALTRSSKLHGPDSRQTRELTRQLTRAQEALTNGARPGASDFRVAD